MIRPAWMFGLLALGVTSWLAPRAATAGDAAVIIVGVEELDYFPNYAVRDGRYSGVARDILDAFAASAGVSFTYRPLPVKRLYADLFNGAIDLKFPDNPGWNADGKQGRAIRYSQPVLPYTDGTMVLPARLGKGLDDFATLGTVSGFTAYAWLDVLAKGKVTLAENPALGALLRQAMTGRIDGAYVNVESAKYLLRTALDRPAGLVFDPGLPHSKSNYLVSTINRTEVVDKLDAWLAAHGADIAILKARHGMEN